MRWRPGTGVGKAPVVSGALAAASATASSIASTAASSTATPNANAGANASGTWAAVRARQRAGRWLRGPDAPGKAGSFSVWGWWAGAGVVLGLLLTLVVFAPAAWLAGTLASLSGNRLVLADARGTVWRGSAVLVLTGGPGSRDASSLPGRLQWRLSLDGTALALAARHACCIPDELNLRVRPGLSRLRIELVPPVPGSTAAIAPLLQWPAAWLAGLGTPWNTLQPSGLLELSSPGFSLEHLQGRWLFNGRAVLDLRGIASRVSTLPVLGSYRFSVNADAGDGGGARVQLLTTEGALQLQGSGTVLGTGGKLRFVGQASAAPGFEAVLSNLLNIIGRRQGASSLISIG